VAGLVEQGDVVGEARLHPVQPVVELAGPEQLLLAGGRVEVEEVLIPMAEQVDQEPLRALGPARQALEGRRADSLGLDAAVRGQLHRLAGPEDADLVVCGIVLVALGQQLAVGGADHLRLALGVEHLAGACQADEDQGAGVFRDDRRAGEDLDAVVIAISCDIRTRRMARPLFCMDLVSGYHVRRLYDFFKNSQRNSRHTPSRKVLTDEIMNNPTDV